jgi:hypothetical protein
MMNDYCAVQLFWMMREDYNDRLRPVGFRRADRLDDRPAHRIDYRPARPIEGRPVRPVHERDGRVIPERVGLKILLPDGRVAWPAILCAKTFAQRRLELDSLLMHHDLAETMYMPEESRRRILAESEAWLGTLKRQKHDFPSTEYDEGQRFLLSVRHQAMRPAR